MPNHPDPTVRRKTGFLLPSFRQSDPLGVGVTVPFFWNLAPNYDVTFSPTILMWNVFHSPIGLSARLDGLDGPVLLL